MAIQGQRFHINLDEDADDVRSSGLPLSEKLTAGVNMDLVADIKERAPLSYIKPPSPPRLKSADTGFPTHRIRTGPSRFRKRTLNRSTEIASALNSHDSNIKASSRVQSGNGASKFSTGNGPDVRQNPTLTDPSIDQENKQRLAQMSDQEIEEARQGLIAGLSPSLIEKLLKKANIDEGRADPSTDLQSTTETRTEQVETSSNNVNFELSSITSDTQRKNLHWDPDGPPLRPPPDLHPASSYPSPLPQSPHIHFPTPTPPPDLDPSDPDFLSALHSTYFPNLPADPSAMAWMTPLDSGAEEESAYSLSQESHPVSALRFDFHGRLLPPRLSAQIPSTKGLHHHAHAPASAGYTVPELSHLARSSYSAQRCIAYQTLGRILYRLGRGDFGQEGEDLCEGLWQLMEQGKVVDQLIDAAAKGDSGNRSIWVTATEAVWLWRKGGGRRWRGR